MDFEGVNKAMAVFAEGNATTANSVKIGTKYYTAAVSGTTLSFTEVTS
jgi:hypothetical protein